LLEKFPYLTRLYARISAEEMTADPVFMVSSDTSDVNNVHDLTDPGFSYSQCSGTVPEQPLPPAPCVFSYCGRRGVCVGVDVPLSYAPDQTTPTAACVCANDATARVTTTGANGQPAIYCEPVANDLDEVDAGAALTNPACEGFDCGAHGACVAMNGNPTCQCEAGYGAVVGTPSATTSASAATPIGCRPVTTKPPALPTVPPIGQTKIPPSSSGSAGTTNAGSGGATGTQASPSSGGASSGSMNAAQNEASKTNDGGCNVGNARRTSVASIVLGLFAAGAARRRRKPRARR